MRILALTHRTPFPPDRGDRIRSFHLLSRLGARHELWLLALDDSARTPGVSEALDSFCHRSEVFVQSPVGRLRGATGSFVRREPLTLGWFANGDARRRLRQWSDEAGFDVAFVYSSSMAPYWLELHDRIGLPGVMDFIDVDSEKWGQYAQYSRPPKRWVYSREQRTLAPYERFVASHAYKSLFVSQAEVETFSSIAPLVTALSLPNGVDGQYFARPELSRRSDPPRIVFVGQMDYHANVDAVVWFARDVLPIVHQHRPAVVFDIVGSRPAPEVKLLEHREGVRVTGWVEDIRSYLWEASVAVAPLRIAQGTQNKVLEAMAASVPAVASPLAARGLAVPGGEHLRVAEGAQDFAQAVLSLLDDEDRAARQVEAGLEMVAEHHSWDASARRLEELLEQAASTGGGGGLR